MAESKSRPALRFRIRYLEARREESHLHCGSTSKIYHCAVLMRFDVASYLQVIMTANFRHCLHS